MLQDLIPSSVAYTFQHDLVLIMGESDQCAELSPGHLKDSAPDNVVVDLCVKIMFHAP